MLADFFQPVKNVDLPLPVANRRTAVFFFRKNLPNFVYDTLRLLEKNPTSLPDTRLIIQGRSVGGLSIEDLMQVKHFADAAKALARDLLDGKFAVGVGQLCKIHSTAGKEEALEWGILRRSQVYVGNCSWIPPDHQNLPAIVRDGLGEAERIARNRPLEAAINAFAFCAKVQPFFDANKRTAMLFMNGILMSNGLYPLFIPAVLDEKTDAAITALYERGDSGKLLNVFSEACGLFYPENIDYGQRYRADGD